MDEHEKNKIDNGWKGQIDKEKKEAEEENKKHYEPTLKIFLSSISMQAMIAMGRIENPVTGKLEKNLEQARFLIDTLGILEEKTKGNLVSEEEILLKESLFNLRMMYVEEKKNG